MAVIHRTTMEPGKTELLSAWLPTRPWYAAGSGEPRLDRVGGFRLDDPEGEVGMEFMVVTDTSGDRPVSYHVPLTYRGAPVDGADQALIGTSEHGVLGRRWVYDGAQDPVLVAQVLALFQGRAEPQAQSVSDTPDPTVTVHASGTLPAVSGTVAVQDGERGTGSRPDAEGVTLSVTRVLRPDTSAEGAARVEAGWRLPDGGEARGVFFTLRG
ncbi:1,4-alpha-glucan branching protein [Streptomyces halstedii]|uniref:maltokinase N-terminal cap-like domain-containing protein n=1 Tax=Streptomyces halstedii TaxID=1944 RepID=UPI0032477C5F